jgi:hypothetical protein
MRKQLMAGGNKARQALSSMELMMWSKKSTAEER